MMISQCEITAYDDITFIEINSMPHTWADLQSSVVISMFLCEYRCVMNANKYSKIFMFREKTS